MKVENNDQACNGGEIKASTWEFTPLPGTPRGKAWDEFSKYGTPLGGNPEPKEIVPDNDNVEE